eukprot:SAG31_NODE_3483_length_4215_cov_2.188533_5_plen_104_part_00
MPDDLIASTQLCLVRGYFLVFVQPFEKYGTLIETYTALIEKVSASSDRERGRQDLAAAEPGAREMERVVDQQQHRMATRGPLCVRGAGERPTAVPRARRLCFS